METVKSDEAVAVPSPKSEDGRRLMELSELSPGQPRVITRPDQTRLRLSLWNYPNEAVAVLGVRYLVFIRNYLTDST